MRLVFVNHAHPDTPHVSGMRLANFAREMAKRGHQVVLLTSSLPGATGADFHASRLSPLLAGHTWAAPLLVAVPPIRRRSLQLIRENRVPTLLRRGLTLWQFVAHGGMFGDWQHAAGSAAAVIAEEFRPDLVWGTFGNTSNLTLAQSLARRARCAWIMDVKDSWQAFVPNGLRRLTALRFRDASSRTSNSRHHQQVAAQWMDGRHFDVIYSGVADEFFGRHPHAAGEAKRDLLLVGSIYDDALLTNYLTAVRDWLYGLARPERESIRFVYAGSDSSRVRRALDELPLPCPVEVEKQLPIPRLAAAASRSFANSYLWASFGFHQKLLELLICGQPLICFPGENEESKALARLSRGSFAPCESSTELQHALTSAWLKRGDSNDPTHTPAWRWSDFASQLEVVFQRAVHRGQL